MSNIAVVTSITGSKDTLVHDQKKGKAQWIAFCDTPQVSKTWTVKPAFSKFKDNRINSRVPKILIHQFIKTKYSIWIDGNIALLKTPEELIEKYLKNHDIALFKHPKRDCLYDEAIRCATAKLDDPETIIEQVSGYEKEGFAKHKGLGECGCILRRHTEQVESFNNYWWSEYTRHSVRDQISFPYAVDKAGLRVNFIDFSWKLAPDNLSAIRGDFIRIVPHIILNPLVN